MKDLLIIDDNNDGNTLLTHHLTHRGWIVETVDDPIRGIERAKSEKYRVILVDLIMLKMDGIEVLSTLKTLKVKSILGVLSGMDETKQLARKAVAMGVNIHVTKEDQVDDTIFKIEQILRAST